MLSIVMKLLAGSSLFKSLLGQEIFLLQNIKTGSKTHRIHWVLGYFPPEGGGKVAGS